MYGIPGFEVDDGPIVALEPLDEGQALTIAREHFAVNAVRAERLDSERDDTFRLDTEAHSYALKVAHPADRLEALQFEIGAMDRIAEIDPTLPVPRILRSVDGDAAPLTALGRRARLLSWLDGELLVDAEPTTPEHDGELGRALGRLTRALEGYEHPAAHRSLAWDPAQFGGLRRVAEELDRREIDELFALYDEVVSPALPTLPHQVVHNDFNPGNVLVDPTGPRYVTGVIDFGDAISTARICDLAVALSYQLFPLGRDWDDRLPFVDAYRMVVPLEVRELDLLPAFVALRFGARILINQWIERGEPHEIDFAAEGNLAALRTVLKEL